MNIIMEKMKQIQTHTCSTICTLSGKRLNSPQIGLQSWVPFSSKKKPSEHTKLLESWLSGLGMSWSLKSDILLLFVMFERAVTRVREEWVLHDILYYTNTFLLSELYEFSRFHLEFFPWGGNSKQCHAVRSVSCAFFICNKRWTGDEAYQSYHNT